MTTQLILPPTRRPGDQPALPAATSAPAVRPEIQPWEPDLWPAEESIPDDGMDCEC